MNDIPVGCTARYHSDDSNRVTFLGFKPMDGTVTEGWAMVGDLGSTEVRGYQPAYLLQYEIGGEWRDPFLALRHSAYGESLPTRDF